MCINQAVVIIICLLSLLKLNVPLFHKLAYDPNTPIGAYVAVKLFKITFQS